MVLHDPIETGEHRRESAHSIAIENAYWNESRRLCHAVIESADDSRDVRAMTVAVVGAVVVGNRIEARDNPAAEIGVTRDAGVDNIDSHAGPGFSAYIAAVQWERALIDAVESPGGRRGGDRGILFDVLYARVASERLRIGITDLDCETFEAARICMVDTPVYRAREGGGVGARVEHHNVSTGNALGIAMHITVAAESSRRHQRDTQKQECTSSHSG